MIQHITRRRILQSASASTLTSLPMMQAWAQKYPSGPVNLILPLQAGSASDVAIRFLAERLSNRMGAGFVVENIAAAARLVGLEKIARSKNDGLTVAALNNSIMGSVAIRNFEESYLLPVAYFPYAKHYL
ncbi:MAG: hypothetical protein EXR35_05500 [Limnohabitans sp.]|nr:hypothetical protein [Limnohabitans sp.]